ncbi:MAG: glycoside hydrolase family 9 protein [Prolixibacteraceae bacterium]|nr:glycoside hydrolase family 9 protein [Prolixibacteraceae bacterium]
MKRFVELIFLLVCCTGSLFSQIDEKLKTDIRNTGVVHSPLPLDYSKSFEAFGLAKKVLVDETLCDMEDMGKWSHRGIGGMSQTTERSVLGKNSLRLTAPTRSPQFPSWGIGFGTSMASFDVGGANWEKYNRLMFYIYPDCEGTRSIYVNLRIRNDGEIKIPEEWGREGIHEINLINRQWNQCFLEITGLPRDKVTTLSFAIETFGKELTMGDFLQFDIDAVQLQVVENPEVVSGWIPAENRIVYSTTGYGIDSEKTAIVRVNNHDGGFKIIEHANNQVVYQGKIKSETTHIGTFETIDFSEFKKEGQFMIKAGDVTTPPFFIHRNIWDNSAWRVLNFMFCQRCGYPVPEKHGTCHSDLNGEHNGLLFSFNGGWHDAGDMSQQAVQTGEIAFSLFEMANRAKEKGNIDLHLRLLEEAQWGLDYVLRTRLGDGFRVQTAGTNLWTDRFIGTIDDAGQRQLRIHNGAFQNFLYSGIEAYAAMSIDRDLMLKENLQKIAIEDFGYAMQRFDSLGYDELIKTGHTTMTSKSQYMATVSWAASLIYKLTKDPYYAEKAAESIKYTLSCQRTEPLKDKNKTSGFFYRDQSRTVIVHFNHHSRDQIYMAALTALSETQPEHKDFKTWDHSIRLYAAYLKNIMQYVQPYGMIPSGVYHIDEEKDSLNFYVQHVRPLRNYAKEYKEQLENGFKLDDKHYLKVFPVWFSYRGNAAVHLTMGKSAALCGKYLNDKELINIAEQQLFWIVGKNPFGQSLIYGEGYNYAQQYCALPGEMVGEIPVGMQSRFNEDTPYWTQFNNATYKEVWGTPAGKWFSLIAEF